MTVSTVYTFGMKMTFVHVHIHGVDKAAQIEADEAKTTGDIGSPNYRLLLSKKNEVVGQFNGNIIDGWWIQSE